MSFLVDTNIVSEIRKGARADTNVAAWFASVPEDSLFLSVLVIGEIRRGIERKRPLDAGQASALETWLGAVLRDYADRILSVDRPVAEEWGRMGASRPLSVVDGLLAATAKVHGLVLVTRNIADVRGLGARLFNPFDPAPRTR
ncbi:MAG: type II toxin-antitoxin system VapC family toxin [Alphaproteobacteria bacterium]